MKRFIYILICIAALSACNRDEFLDVTPKGLVIPQNVNDYRLLLDQIDQSGQGFPKISPGFGEGYSHTDLMSDDFAISDDVVSFYGETSFNMFTWADDIFEINQEDGNWQTLYGQIYVTNVVLEEIMDANNGTQEEKLEIQASAKMHRAFAYFCLVNMYGLHYNSSTSATDLAVPLRLTSNLENVDLSRASVQEIYDFMLDEVNDAVDHLPDMPEFVHRPSKMSAYAFLSKIHLFMGNFQASLDAANNSLALYSSLLDLNEVPDVSWWPDPLIDYPDLEDNPEIMWHKESPNPFRTLILSDELRNLYQDGDQRIRGFSGLDLFGRPDVEGTVLVRPVLAGYRMVGFTVPEMLLIRAECNARLNNASAAIDDLNTLRLHRFAADSFTPLDNTNPTEVLELVKTERRVELAGGGARFFDLKRYNVYDNANISITHTLEGQTFTLEAGSKNWAVPIASKYILETPEIGENVRD